MTDGALPPERYALFPELCVFPDNVLQNFGFVLAVHYLLIYFVFDFGHNKLLAKDEFLKGVQEALVFLVLSLVSFRIVLEDVHLAGQCVPDELHVF